MRIKCFTNKDKWALTKWPQKFVTVPEVGDYIEGTGPGDYKPVLKVYSRRHVIERTYFDEYSQDVIETAVLVLELN